MRIVVKSLVIGVLLLVAFAWGFLSHRNAIFPFGLLQSIGIRSLAGEQVRVNTPAGADDPLADLPYLDRSYDPDSDARGILHHVPGEASPGLSFYCSRTESRGVLIDMDGTVVHEWTAPTGHWQFATLLPNGDVIVLLKDRGVFRLDRDSNELWSVTVRAHHDLWVAEDGSIFVLIREAGPRPEIHPVHDVVEDSVLVLTPDGEERERISVRGAFEDTPFAFLLPRVAHREIHVPENTERLPELDLFHTNHVEVFDGRLAAKSPLFAKGNVLLSLRNICTIAILDGRTRKVIWAWGPGNLAYQHDPTLLDNGHLLVFNNGTKASEVLEIDPHTFETVWRYGPGKGFFSRLRGSNQRLPNGNTLITESDKGYVLEVTPAGKIVWHFANPDVNEKGERGAIFRMTRYPREELEFLGER